MKIHFITGNAGKLSEIKTIIPEVEGLDIDLPEIQDVDAQKIIEAKLHEGLIGQDGPLMVEDTSLYINSLNGLPGPLIKWFLKALGTDGVARLAGQTGDTSARAQTIIGYATDDEDIRFFTGVIEGEIVVPRGDNGFGWDAIFQPKGYDKTFAEMTSDEKNEVSMRRLAAEQLRDFLAQA